MDETSPLAVRSPDSSDRHPGTLWIGSSSFLLVVMPGATFVASDRSVRSDGLQPTCLHLIASLLLVRSEAKKELVVLCSREKRHYEALSEAEGVLQREHSVRAVFKLCGSNQHQSTDHQIYF